MADDQTQTVDPSDQTNALLQQMLRQTLTGQSMQPTPEPPHSGDNRTWGSLLGQALVGGAGPGSTDAQNEQAGLRALQQVGLGMMSGSDYSYQRHSLGSIIANAVGGAQESNAAQIAAQQGYAQKAQEMQLARIKEAVPLLTLQTQLQQAARARGLVSGNTPTTPTSISAAHTGGIGAVGNPPGIERDPNAGTAGQQGNNSGNLMVPPGGTLPTGATGVIPLDGGRQLAAFPDVATGIAAQSDNLAAYQATHGINTVRGAVTRWVGDPKADLTSYIGDIAKMAGVDPDAPVDLTDPKIQRAFFMAQQPHESGKPWLNAADVDKGIALAQARRAAGRPPGAPVVAGASQTPPAASTAPPAPVVGKGVPIPAGRPTGPSIVTDQPPAGNIVAGPPGTATVGQPLPPSPAVAGNVNAIIGGMTGAGASPTTLAPGPAAARPAAPTAVAGPPVTAPTPPPAPPPQFPDVVQGDVVTRHPGTYQDFLAHEALPIPTTEDYNPNLSAAEQAKFAARAQGIQAQIQHLSTLNFTDQPKASAEIDAAKAALAADIQAATQEKALNAAKATTTFTTAQNKAVQDRYDAAVAAYRTAAQGKATFNQDIVKSQSEKRDAANQKMLEPYAAGAVQAQQILPISDLAKQVLPGLPANAAPWLADEKNRAQLAPFERFMPANWREAVQSADTFQQVMGGMVAAMGANIVSGQPGGRESAYEQFKTMLPVLSQSAEGRERALLFIDELAKRRISENEFMQNYSMDPKNRDPELKVANMSGSTSAMNASLGPMVRLPPSRYDPNVPMSTPKGQAMAKTYADYFTKLPDNARYITYSTGEDGKAHPVVRVKAPGQTRPEAVTE